MGKLIKVEEPMSAHKHTQALELYLMMTCGRNEPVLNGDPARDHQTLSVMEKYLGGNLFNRLCTSVRNEFGVELQSYPDTHGLLTLQNLLHSINRII
jgi:hypothetical protein